MVFHVSENLCFHKSKNQKQKNDEIFEIYKGYMYAGNF